VQTKRAFDEIAARFREELDYGLEADRTQEHFAGATRATRVPHPTGGARTAARGG
jgi:predicted unusual protein kinase regulating ubiquinone biosynthesis (AarF/ABC1/UbiB family)